MKSTLPCLLAMLLMTAASTSSAQLLTAKDGPIVYGHHHLNTTNVAAQKKFFVDTLGGKLVTIGTNNTEIVEFPNVLIFFRNQAPAGGTRGTTVNHIGFSVPNLRPMVDRIKANGFRMITTTEAPGREVKDDIAGPLQPGGASIAFALGPDDVKVELVEAKQQTIPITLHHVHFFNPKNTDMQAWYVKTFGAKPRSGGAFPAGDLPGVALNFSPSNDPVVGTQGRALDHIGFEVKDLEAFCKKLEADGIKLAVPYRKVPALNIAIAFLTDPWGTYIELTEGLDKVTGAPSAQADPPRSDRFGALRFLAGNWRGSQAGKPGQGTAERTYQFILNDRFLQETNTSTYPPQEKNTSGEVHHHMSMISFDGTRKRFVFRQFHTEGFVNTYLQEPTSDDQKIVFVTEAIENIPDGYRARETYTILSRDAFTERFEIAEPGKEFELYSEAHLERVR